MGICEALVHINMLNFDMGDDPLALIEELEYHVAEECEPTSEIDATGSLSERLTRAYKLLSEKKPNTFNDFTVSEIFECDRDHYTILNSIYDEVKVASESSTYQAVCAIYKYAKANGCKSHKAEAVKKYLEEMDWKARNLAFDIAHEYWRYISDEFIRTKSNCAFNVGYPVTPLEIKEHPHFKGYEYICHSQIEGTSLNVFCGFKPIRDNYMEVQFKIVRNGYLTEDEKVVGLEYIASDNAGSVFLADDKSTEFLAKELARAVNTVSEVALSYTNAHPEFKKTCKYNGEHIMMN